MKEGIHPKFHEVEVRCACGNTFKTHSTKPELHLEICSACHPFFTGRQKLIDTEGRVERFTKRFGAQTPRAARPPRRLPRKPPRARSRPAPSPYRNLTVCSGRADDLRAASRYPHSGMKGQSRSLRRHGGHVQVCVADLDRAIVFYRDTFGFELVADGRPAGLGGVSRGAQGTVQRAGVAGGAGRRASEQHAAVVRALIESSSDFPVQPGQPVLQVPAASRQCGRSSRDRAAPRALPSARHRGLRYGAPCARRAPAAPARRCFRMMLMPEPAARRLPLRRTGARASI